MASNMNRQYNRGSRNTYTKNMYVYGNTAVQPDYQRQWEEPQRKTLSNQARKNREKARHMSFGYILFLVSAFAVAGMILIGYIRLNAEVITLNEQIASKEKQLNELRIDNAEALSRIESSVDLEEIKRVAIQELGMTYPKEGQIVSYEGAAYDYVRKVSDGN